MTTTKVGRFVFCNERKPREGRTESDGAGEAPSKGVSGTPHLLKIISRRLARSAVE